MKRFLLRAAATAAVTSLLAAAGSGCEEPAPVRSPETLAVEAKAGSFLDYYEEILTLSRRYAAFPDSFQAAVDSLPGSHLTDEEWEAWTTPYVDDAGPLAERLEKVIAELSKPVTPAAAPVPSATPTPPQDQPNKLPVPEDPGD